MDVECKVVRDILRGDDVCEIKVHLKDYLKDEMPVGEDWAAVCCEYYSCVVHLIIKPLSAVVCLLSCALRSDARC